MTLIAEPPAIPREIHRCRESSRDNVRIKELDAIRGIAAIAVLICHLPRGFWFGETGVDLFFVLSGYLITGIILQNLDQPRFLQVFYWRRSLRIFPIYYLMLVTVMLLNSLRGHPDPMNGWLYYFAYLQNVPAYWGGTTPPMCFGTGHTWTLAIEEQFYLFWPAAILLVGRRRLPWLCACFIALPIVLRAMGLTRVVLFGHTDGLAMGGLLAWLATVVSLKGNRRIIATFATLAVASLIVYFAMWFGDAKPSGVTGKAYLASNFQIVVLSLAYLGIVGAIVGLAGTKWLSALRWKWLAFIGTISYGLYLYHWPIYELLDIYIKFRWQYGEPWWSDVLKVAVSFGVAILSWHVIEKPLMKLKDRVSYSKAS